MSDIPPTQGQAFRWMTTNPTQSAGAVEGEELTERLRGKMHWEALQKLLHKRARLPDAPRIPIPGLGLDFNWFRVQLVHDRDQ